MTRPATQGPPLSGPPRADLSLSAESPVPGKQLLRRLPPPALRHLVTRYSGYRESDGAAATEIETATLTVPVVVSFAERFRIGIGREPGAEDAVPSFVAGLYAGPVFIRSPGTAICLQIDFTPLGARHFLQLPMAGIAGRMVPLDDLRWPGLDALARRLEDTADWQGRFDLAERFVATRLLSMPESSPAVVHAVTRLAATGGRLRVGTLARELGWSRKHLAHRFNEEVGLPPKAIAGILRFGEAQRRATRADIGMPGREAPDWADIAAAAGYADQAHMIREFRRLAGETPAQWHARTAASRASR